MSEPIWSVNPDDAPSGLCVDITLDEFEAQTADWDRYFSAVVESLARTGEPS
jgi:hypothetical protein